LLWRQPSALPVWLLGCLYTLCLPPLLPPAADTIPAAVQALYMSGSEIATHTVTHPGYPSAEEIVGCRDWLVNATGIPAKKITGFR
jgi:hypothetical protein